MRLSIIIRNESAMHFMTSENFHELQKELGRISLLLGEPRREEREAALVAVKGYAAAFVITAMKLLRVAGFLKAKKKQLPAKYYDPSSGNSLSRQDSCPKWLVGKNRNNYLIREAPEPWWPEKAR